MAEDDVALVREQYTAWNEGCSPTEWVERYFAPDGRWETVPDLPDSEVHIGLASITKMIEELVASFGRYQVEMEEFIEGPGSVVLAYNFVGEGQIGTVPVALHIFHLHELADGKNTRVAAFLDRDQALAATGISE